MLISLLDCGQWGKPYKKKEGKEIKVNHDFNPYKLNVILSKRESCNRNDYDWLSLVDSHQFTHCEKSFYILQGVTITLLVAGIFGTDVFHRRLPGDIPPAVAFEILLYVSGLISSHPFIIYHIYW